MFSLVLTKAKKVAKMSVVD